MEQLTLRPRTPVEGAEVENWEDDFDNLEEVHFRTASTATSIVSLPQNNHRDSASSRLSMRSESNQGDENWDVLVDEQASIKDAIAIAKSKGIPLPTNVPRSALEGGTIRRLKGKEIKKAIADDWSEDLDLPGAEIPLKLAKHDDRDLSDSLRQISAAFRTSPKTPETKDSLDKTIRSPKSRTAPTPITLDAFRDTEDDADFADVGTIKVAKQRSPEKPLLFQQPPTPVKLEMENAEDDLEIPADGQLKLSTRKPAPQTPQQVEDFDLEWAEGSLGTRHAGTKRGGRSARSSSASAFSPSVSSAFTAESEDEGLDGLILPDGPIKFDDKLKQRQQEQPSEPAPRSVPEGKLSLKSAFGQEDFFSGLEIGDGEVFDAAKLTLNRNVKHKSTRPASPTKRTATTLNFTSSKTQGTISRLPRFQPTHDRHDRARSNLEPVSETGAAISTYQRPNSRLGNHSTHSSVSAIPTHSTPSTPSTPSRRLLRGAESRPDLRHEQPTTTNALLLRAKRSMPVLRNLNSPTKATPYVRPPSRQETGSRLNIPSRPKTPTDRADSRFGEARKSAIPFLPAGASAGQSQHISIKSTTTRHYRGQGSDGSGDSMSAAQRSLSRLAGLGRPETPGRGRSNLTPAELAAQAKKTITKPTRRRNYGDGSELEVFDDLPTSATIESKFTKTPIGRGAPRSLRSKLGLSHLNPSTSSLASTRRGSDTPVPATPLSPLKGDFPTTAVNTTNVPRFARDTAASRIAREQRQISTTFQNMRGEPLQPISTNWKSTASTRNNQGSLRKKKSDKVQQKPHLIKPMGGDMNRPKTEKGMQYNPLLYTWEGNENALAPFDVPDFHPRVGSPIGQGHASPGTKANLALISNVGSSVTGVQVVGGMVFDPSQMRWLKIAENADGTAPSLRSGSVQVEEEEDVFAGLEDLKEEDETRSRSGTLQNASGFGHSRDSFGDGEAGHSSGDEWGVSEEFDVGPEFIRRQRNEEDRWRRKVEKWLRRGREAEQEEGRDGRGGWRWAIRDLVMAQGEAQEEF
ncbi:hypothetical protein A1O3_00210 [Capronia epimyces CBS 606.96]|uniref:Cytokinesis regulator n=1 Tax=Capronia epimyces CBS 606.96 TaxID=1182542 RepID=W9YPQ8_9EURO|nr:uncharacterized protein A1O3_00210 [Capronia epimyces CBS 606.96]EXJ91660.1 hypothetical protein A1O3_00210 [Capronia epimyces CBS 606.96]